MYNRFVQTPPYGSAPAKKSKIGWILGGLAAMVLLCCCGGFFLVGNWAKNGGLGKFASFMGCTTGLSRSREALLEYASKHNGKLPGKLSWQDDIKPYLKAGKNIEGLEGLAIPGPTDNFCDKENQSGMAFNVALAGKSLDTLNDKMGTVILFEVAKTGRNQTAEWKEGEFSSSPKIAIVNESRGWIRIPVEGRSSVRDKSGKLKPMPSLDDQRTGDSVP